MVLVVEPETTMHYARILKNEFGFEVMPHLTCVGHTKTELLEILEEFSDEGFCNIMALRGILQKEKKNLGLQKEAFHMPLNW